MASDAGLNWAEQLQGFELSTSRPVGHPYVPNTFRCSGVGAEVAPSWDQ